MASVAGELETEVQGTLLQLLPGTGPAGTVRHRVAGHISSRTSCHWILRRPARRTDPELQLVVRKFQTLDMSIR